MNADDTARNDEAPGANGFRLKHSNGSHFFYKNENTGKTTTAPKHSKDLKKAPSRKF